VAATGLTFYRKRKGLTQADIAAALSIDGGTMSRLESGDLIPTAAQVDKLVELLEVPPPHLFSKHILAEVAERAQLEAAS
jgi:transcriptional regulator with XRE-family HTH domain